MGEERGLSKLFLSVSHPVHPVHPVQAPQEDERRAALSFRVVDGIVIDPKSKVQAGPNAVILPPGSE